MSGKHFGSSRSNALEELNGSIHALGFSFIHGIEGSSLQDTGYRMQETRIQRELKVRGFEGSPDPSWVSLILNWKLGTGNPES